MPDAPEPAAFALLFVPLPEAEAEATDPELKRLLKVALRLLRFRCVGLVKLDGPGPGPCPAPPSGVG